MKLKKWLENWDMTSLKIKTPFLEMDWNPKEADKDAAWELYIELLTRVTTQGLKPEDGDEETALSSIYAIFGITREIIKRHGRDCITLTKLAVIILNQVVRPFTAKWHKACVRGEFNNKNVRDEFRTELSALQVNLRKYTKMLADVADVEDLTDLED